MIRPTVSEAAEEVYVALGPLTTDDEKYDWALLQFCEANAGRLQDIDDLVRDTDAGPGWSTIMDADLAPLNALAWLGQFVGVRIPAGLTEQQQRDRVKGTDGFNRGKISALITAAQLHLTGAKTVQIRERDGSAYRLTVITYTAQTPDAAAVLAAIKEQKPGGIILTHNILPGQDYTLVRTNNATYTIARTNNATYTVLRDAT